MNILVVHETEYIEKVIFEYQIIPELWASRGHNVFVIDYPSPRKKRPGLLFASKPAYITGVKKTNKKKGVTLIRPATLGIPLLGRLFSFVQYFFLIPRIIKNHKIDVIFLYAAPNNGLQTLCAAKRYNIPIHFRLLDVLHQLVPMRCLSLPTLWIEKWIYPRVSELTAITPRLTEYAIKMGANKKTTSYLPSGADKDLFFAASKNKQLMKKFGIAPNDKVILFAGTLFNFSGLDILISYFGRNLDLYPGYKFLIVGHGAQEKQLNKIIRRYHLEKRVIMTGFIEYSQLNQYINLASVCINPFLINKTTDIIFPGKIYQYLACGKPVVASPLRGVVDIFPANNKVGIFYALGTNPKETMDAIEKAFEAKVNNTNPFLQEISLVLEKKLAHLAAKKNRHKR